MDSLIQRLKKPDRTAAITAVVLFVVLAFGQATHIVLALLLAIVAYVALVLFRGASGQGRGLRGESAADRLERSGLAYESSVAKVQTLRGLADRVQKEGVRDLVVRICDQSDGALKVMSDRSDFTAAPIFLEQLLEPAEGILDTYVRVSVRGVDAAKELMTRYESQDLPMVERAARLFREMLAKQEKSDLKALESTLAFAPESSPPPTPRSFG